MAVQGQLSERALAAQLSAEIEEWKGRGYHVRDRTSTTAHLLKPHGSVIWPILGWLMLSGILVWLFGAAFGAIPLLVASGITLILILSWHSGRRDELVLLTVERDGSVYRE